MPDEPASIPGKRRRYPWIVLGLVGVLLALVAAAPLLLSSPRVRDAALGWYNQSISGSISVEDAALSWLGGQSLRAVTIRDARGRTVLRLAELTTDLTLVDALRGRLTLGRTVLSGLDVDLAIAADGSNNLTAALGGEPGPASEGGGPVVPVTGNMTLVDGRVAIAAPDIEPIILEQLSGDVSMTDLDGPIRLRFNGRSRQGELQGSIDLDGQVDNLFDNGRLNPDAATADVEAGIEDLPVDALDRLLGLQGVLSAALGNRTSIAISAGGDTERQDVSIDAQAPNAQLTLKGTIVDKWFRLRDPATARLVVTPALVEALEGLAEDEAPARLAGPVPLRLSAERLDVPLEGFTPARVALESVLTADDSVRLSGIENVGDLSVEGLQLLVSSPGLGEGIHVSLAGRPITRDRTGDLTLEADIQRLFDEAGDFQPDEATIAARTSIAGVPTAIVDAALRQDGLLVDAAGDTFDLSMNADTDPDGRITVSGGIESARIQARDVQLAIDRHITLTQPAQLRLGVTPGLWQRLLGDDAAYQLARTADWTIDVESLRAPIPTARSPAFQPGATQLAAALSTASLQLADPESAATTRLEDLRLDIAAGDGLHDFGFNVSTNVMQPGGVLESLDASPLRVSLNGNAGLNDDASARRITSALELSSEGVNASLSTAIEAGFSRLTLAEPSSFGFTLTPALVSGWQDSAAPAVALSRSARIRGTLERLVVPLSPFSLAGLQAGGRAGPDGDGAQPVSLESPGGVVTHVDDPRIAFDFTGEDGGRGSLELNARVRSDRGEPGNIALDASVSRLLDADGMPAADTASLELDGTLQRMPVALVDQLLNMDGAASATLGATADIELSTRLERMRGPLSLALGSPNARADIKARIEDGDLTLTEPLVAQVEPTPEFGSKVLAKVHPILETTQRAERPIRLEVPAEGVLVPIEDYDFGRITVPRMTLDFGRIVLKSGWLLRGVVGLGQRFGKLGGVEKEEFVAWFTPGVLELADGRIQYARRLDVLLAEKLHLATWGDADIVGDQSNLVLAFMPGTMERVFSITVADDDALHVPITGPLSSPSVDFKKAGADLARLRAQEEVSGENPLAGALLGAVAGKATGRGGGPVPPPSVTPLPWAEQLEALDAAEDRRRQSATQEPSDARQEDAEPAPEKKRSTEQQVIDGLIDIFGGKKE